LQRRAERGDELVRQIAHEPDRVRENRVTRVRQLEAPHRRIKRCEQLVGRVRIGAGEAIEESRLACVRVPDERDGRDLRALAFAPRGFTLRDDLVEPRVQRLDAIREQSTVGFQLRFAGTAQADTALLSLQVRPASHQPRREVLQLRELHLELTFEAARALREDVENEAGAIEHPTLQQCFEIALLARRQRVIEDDQVGALGLHLCTHLLRLTAADI
jgi:hypothetical protein